MWAMPEEYRDLVATNDSIFLILPRQMPDGNSYQHVARVKLQVGDTAATGDRGFQGSTTKQFLSMGNFDVKSVAHHSVVDGLLYFVTMAPQPREHHLYVTKDNMVGDE